MPSAQFNSISAPAKTVVVIPTYNRREWVAEAVDSVLAQAHRDFELIVVDDDRLRDPRASSHCALDLGEFDTETANLHLMIEASQIFDVTPRQKPRPIAGLVEARGRASPLGQRRPRWPGPGRRPT